MENNVLEKYKSAWQNEESFNEKKLSKTEIQTFLRKNSKSITTLFKKGLIADIILKSIIALSCFVLIYFEANTTIIIFSLTMAILIIGMIIFQIISFKNIPKTNYSETDLIQTLELKINYYYKKHIKSLYIGAFSGSLFFLFGMLYYFLYEYGEIPNLQIDDYIVISIGIIISYIFSAFIQVKQHNFQIKQIEVCIHDIEEQTINLVKLKKLKNKRLRILIYVLILLTLGILLFLYFLFK